MSIKNRIKEFREKYELTQYKLAYKVDVSRQIITSLEKGQYNPSIILAYKIAQVFNLAIEQVFILKNGAESGNKK
jgi:putative transcriptional regulator